MYNCLTHVAYLISSSDQVFEAGMMDVRESAEQVDGCTDLTKHSYLGDLGAKGPMFHLLLCRLDEDSPQSVQ